MPHRIPDIMRQRAQGEGVFIHTRGVAEHRLDEIAGPDVVQDVREETAAEREVAQVQDNGAAVRVRARFVELRCGGLRILLAQERADVRRPQRIDVRFVRENGVCGCGPWRETRRRDNQCTAPADKTLLKSTLNVPNGWPRHSGRKPSRTT